MFFRVLFVFFVLILVNLMAVYQDVKVNNEIVSVGTDLCSNRYDLLRPIFDEYQKPFKVLDVGAAQGFFSFSIAQDYPQSLCIMVDENTSYYGNHGDFLYDLCKLNNHLDNVIYLRKALSFCDLMQLNKEEHFDFVLAFLVVHLMSPSFKEQTQIIDELLKFGDNLIIEVASDIGVVLSSYVEFLSTKIECRYLGEVVRHRNSGCPRLSEGFINCPCRGKIFLFKSKIDKDSKEKEPFRGIKKETYEALNGIHPEDFSFINGQQTTNKE